MLSLPQNMLLLARKKYLFGRDNASINGFHVVYLVLTYAYVIPQFFSTNFDIHKFYHFYLNFSISLILKNQLSLFFIQQADRFTSQSFLIDDSQI